MDELEGDGFTTIIARLAALNYNRVIMWEIAFIAKVRILKSAINVEEEKEKIGRYPEKPKNILKDPFTGVELIYKLKDSGFIIHSVGRDLKDDGGKEDDDIVFVK